MANFIIESVNKLKEPRKKQLGYGVVQHGSLYADFKVMQSNDDDSVWAAFPSYQKKDGKFHNQVRLATKDANQEFTEALNHAWASATVYEGSPKKDPDEEPKKEKKTEEPTTKAPF